MSAQAGNDIAGFSEGVVLLFLRLAASLVGELFDASVNDLRQGKKCPRRLHRWNQKCLSRRDRSREAVWDYQFRPDHFSFVFLVFPTRLTLLMSLLDFLEANFAPELVLLSRGINLPAIGEPSPVQASHPGPALNAPLLPA